MEPTGARTYPELVTEAPTSNEPGDDRPKRVLLQDPKEDTKGRGGCLALGGVLGVLFGIMFALYALPPILRHYYGEENVDVGEVYEDEGRTIRVTGVLVGLDPLTIGPNIAGAAGTADEDVVTVVVRTTGWPTDEPREGRYRLEIEGIEDWVNPLPPITGEMTSDPPLAAGEQEVHLRFAIPPGLTAETVKPAELHLEDPLVKFVLPEARIVSR